MKLCGMCGTTSASVSTPSGWLCRPCHRDVRLAEQVDNAIGNGPTCPVDASLLNDQGECLECYERALDIFIRAGVSVG